jgi:hypothetical protein
MAHVHDGYVRCHGISINGNLDWLKYFFTGLALCYLLYDAAATTSNLEFQDRACRWTLGKIEFLSGRHYHQ